MGEQQRLPYQPTKIDLTEDEINQLEFYFYHNQGSILLTPQPPRPRLYAQLQSIISTLQLQPFQHIRRLLHYPLFKSYSYALLGKFVFQCFFQAFKKLFIFFYFFIFLF